LEEVASLASEREGAGPTQGVTCIGLLSHYDGCWRMDVLESGVVVSWC